MLQHPRHKSKLKVVKILCFPCRGKGSVVPSQTAFSWTSAWWNNLKEPRQFLLFWRGWSEYLQTKSFKGRKGSLAERSGNLKRPEVLLQSVYFKSKKQGQNSAWSGKLRLEGTPKCNEEERTLNTAERGKHLVNRQCLCSHYLLLIKDQLSSTVIQKISFKYFFESFLGFFFLVFEFFCPLCVCELESAERIGRWREVNEVRNGLKVPWYWWISRTEAINCFPGVSGASEKEQFSTAVWDCFCRVLIWCRSSFLDSFE